MLRVRVTQNMLNSQFLYNITNIDQRMQTQENEISTGKTLTVPSDNPLGVSQDMSIRQIVAETTGYQSTIVAGMSWTNATAGSMQNIISSLQSLQSIVLSGSSTTSQSAAAKQALSDEAQQLQDGINQTLDMKQGTRYLFGGTQTNTRPSSAVQAGTASNAPISYQVSSGISIEVNVTANSIMLNKPTGASNNLRDTLTNIVNDLKSGSNSALTQDLSDLQDNLAQVINLNADLGARTQRLTALQSQLSQYATTMSNEKGVIEGADMAQAITQFQTDQTVYTAALKMGSQILLPSLVSYLPNG